ncbi:MAG: LytTR family DNA-binding domain-containing protein [Cyclobacteriaceae bacterium]
MITRSQIIVLDKEWNFIESCNTLVKIDKINNFFDELFFLQGYQKEFAKLHDGESHKLYCVWANFFGEESYYDFIIKSSLDNFFVIIYDFKEQYEKTIDLQQERNVSSIERSELQRKFEKVEEEKALIEKLYNENISDVPREFVFIKTDLMWVNVSLKSILYFEAYGDYIKVHTEKKIYVIYNRMKNVEEKLSSRDFIRIHRSFIVRIDKINNIETSNLQLGDKILPLGNMYRKDLLEKISQI